MADNAKPQAAEFVIRTRDGIEWNAFCLEFQKNPNHEFSNTHMIYATADNVDEVAKALSRVMSGVEIKLTCMARIRARYMDGKRVMLKDMKDFYLFDDEEVYKATKFLDSEQSGVWI